MGVNPTPHPGIPTRYFQYFFAMFSPSPSISPILQPLQLGPFTLKNRIVMASLTRSRAVPTNVPIELSAEYYGQRARGGASMIISEGALIAQQGCVTVAWPPHSVL